MPKKPTLIPDSIDLEFNIPAPTPEEIRQAQETLDQIQELAKISPIFAQALDMFGQDIAGSGLKLKP